MRELIKKILKEEADTQSKMSSCVNDKTGKIEQYLQIFNAWRTGVCNQDNFYSDTNQDNSRNIIKIINKNFGNQKQIKLKDGTIMTRDQYRQSLINNNNEKIKVCFSQYVGETLTSQEYCSQKIIDEYSNDGVRVAFNKAAKSVFDEMTSNSVKIDDAESFNIFNSNLDNNRDDLKPIKSKEINKLESPTSNQKTLKTQTNIPKTNVPEKNFVDGIIHKIKKRFGI